jgi:hypothetical protein
VQIFSTTITFYIGNGNRGMKLLVLFFNDDGNKEATGNIF